MGRAVRARCIDFEKGCGLDAIPRGQTEFMAVMIYDVCIEESYLYKWIPYGWYGQSSCIGKLESYLLLSSLVISHFQVEKVG
jgi:hypothetical protein